jgi:hypothetical protein
MYLGFSNGAVFDRQSRLIEQYNSQFDVTVNFSPGKTTERRTDVTGNGDASRVADRLPESTTGNAVRSSADDRSDAAEPTAAH